MNIPARLMPLAHNAIQFPFPDHPLLRYVIFLYKRQFLDYIQEELEVRIGERISNNLTETQLNEFDQITNQDEATEWLEKNCPSYHEIVTRTINELKDEIRLNRTKLI